MSKKISGLTIVMDSWIISVVLILVATLPITCIPELHYCVLSHRNKQNCPTINKTCSNLSLCIDDLRNQSQATSTMTVVFVLLPGVHHLDQTITLKQYMNVSFIGQGHWVQQPRIGMNQSTVIIKCTNDAITAFNISNMKWVNFDTLTITNCGKGISSNYVNLSLKHVLFQHISNIGLYWNIRKSTFKAIVRYCNFYNNGFLEKKSNCHANFTCTAGCNSDAHQIQSAVQIFGSTFYSGVLLQVGLNIKGIAIVVIDSCLFKNNNASLKTVAIHGIGSNISVNNTHFINNLATRRSQITGNMHISLARRNYIHINNCVFSNNHRSGLTIDAGIENRKIELCEKIEVHIFNTIFENNLGSLGAAFRIISTEVTKIRLANVSALSNKLIPRQKRSGLEIYSAVHLKSRWQSASSFIISNVTIANNEMTGLYAEDCSISFQSPPSLIANNTSSGNGGGMWIDANTIVYSYKEGSVSFINNTAVSCGGAIYSEANTYYLRKPYMPLFHAYVCSLAQLTARFYDNEAAYGKAIYGGLFYECINGTNDLYSLLQCSNSTQPSTKNQSHWPVFDNIATNLLPETVSSGPIAVCLCNSHSTDCSNRTFQRKVYPGQTVILWLVTVGMCGGIIPGVLVTKTNGVHISSIDSNQQTSDACIGFQYQMKKTNMDNGSMTIYAGDYDSVFLQVFISFLPCPSGFELVKGHCECDHIMADNIADLVQCNVSSVMPVSRGGNNWLYYDHQHNCTVAHKDCPFAYCNPSIVYLSLDQPDLQCMYNRSGTLCGECKPGLSLMLGSNECGYCENKFLSLVIAFGIAGMLLVVFLLGCNLTISQGSINGLLFYANIVKLNEDIFFPNGNRIPILSQFIDWLNLDLGIETCFYNGLDGYWKTWLQFVFPFYVWLLILAIIVCCNHSGKLSRLFGNNTVPVLATLVLMSYSRLLRTITNALMVAVIKCNGKKWSVWSVDGNVVYFGKKHIPMFVVSLLILVIGLLYTLLVFSSQWLQHYSGRCCRSSYDPVVKLKPLIDAYAGPYKDRYRYWTGLLLIIRIIVTATFSYTSGTTPQVNNYIIILITILLLVVGKAGVYRKASLSNLELSYILNLALLCFLNNFCTKMKWELAIFSISTALVSVSFAFAGVTVCVHTFIALKKLFSCQMKVSCTDEDREATKPLLQQARDSSEQPYSPANVIQRRESLIFDDQFF